MIPPFAMDPIELVPEPESMRPEKKLLTSHRRVSFAPCPTVLTYQDEAEEDELHAKWYTKEEMQKIWMECKLCILAYHQVGRQPTKLPSQFCIRGLESSTLSKSRRMQKRIARKETTNAVVTAQKAWHGYAHPDHLRNISEIRSRIYVSQAIERATQDSRIWLDEFQIFTFWLCTSKP
ncbi:hypothetical protein SEMRO_846_G210121.1 [Seminavis robusta]|uniref:Uncharacterized protein n=1 Tax=Seminavis robusta TaxID=568900 RepID=A0A9N8HLR5_9STRA|nr:hypothetical protein SEMRO_846_G210121.1 [Seminavis robusta]|eukprot:Sro846_g210121.1  (178) ;mRNA; f:13469-14002